MREEGDAPALLRVEEREPALGELEQEPDAEEVHRRDLPDDEEDEGQHLGLGQEHDVGAENAGDRPRGADVRDARAGCVREGERHDALHRDRDEPR